MISGISNRATMLVSMKDTSKDTDPATPPMSDQDKKLKDVAGQLEGLFVQQLFKAMRATVPEGEGFVSGGAGEDIFTGLLDQHLAAETPKQWENGVTQALFRQLRGIAGATSPDAAAASSANAPSNAPSNLRSSAN